VQQAAAKLVTEVPYDEAQRLFGDLTGVSLGSCSEFATATQRLAILDYAHRQGLTVHTFVEA
jgi:hypothetical protein